MKKILKILLIIITIILVIIILHTIRNFIIITNLQNNLKPYLFSTNCYTKSIVRDGSNGTATTISYYKNGNNELQIIERVYTNGTSAKITTYNNENNFTTYYDTDDDKIVKTNTNDILIGKIPNSFETCDNNLIYKIFFSCIVKITEVNYNGESCYLLTNFFNPTHKEYFEKATGLNLETNINFVETKREYQFDNVENEIFIQPDNSLYRTE